jgi:hypothetical protein
VEQPGDVLVLGFDASEQDRFEDFQERNPNRPARAPLIEAGLDKEDCKAMVRRAGIELPMMYRMGYDNANCIGCVKGGEGYFRAIREDFPDEFEELCKVQDELGGAATCTATAQRMCDSACATWAQDQCAETRNFPRVPFSANLQSRNTRPK